MAHTPEGFASELAGIWGGSLKAVVLYGSAASGDHRHDSDFNILVVVDGIDPVRVRTAARVTRKWVRAGNPAPLLMTPEFLGGSCDTYPIEWLDMADHHRVLAGEDPLSGLSFSDHNLRLELEREMKSAWLKLLGHWQTTAASPSDVRELMVKSSSTFVTLFRGFLRLMAVRPLPPRLKVPEALAGKLKPGETFDPAVFAYIQAVRDRDRNAWKLDPMEQMDRYLAALAAVIRRIDDWT